MFLTLLVSFLSVVSVCDTLDVATVSSRRNTATASVVPVQNMSEARIARLGTVGLHEAVGQFSGVSVKDYGGVGGLKTVSVRNMGAGHTAVIYDGIAISDAQNGQIDISRFNLDDIACVSMSIGLPDDIFTSARYMTSAGLLRFESRMPVFEQGPTGVDARMTSGSFGTYSPYIALKQRLDSRYAMKIALNGTFSKGDYPFLLHNGKLLTKETRFNSDVKTYGAQADFHADWNSSGKLKAKVNFHHSERGLPGSVVLYSQNASERLWDRSLISNVMYDNEFETGWKFHADAGFTHSCSRHLDAGPVSRESIYNQNEYSLAARTQYMPSGHWKIVIAEDAFINTLDSNIPECPFPVRFTSATAVTAQYEGRTLTVTAGAAGLYVTEDLMAGNAPDDRFRISPMVGLSWNFHKGLYLRSSFKEGFRVPTFNDLYYSRVGNRDLRPEIARQCNMGLAFSGTYVWGTVDLTADGYYNFIKDKIVAVPTMFIWRMRNVGEVVMYGTDLTASVSLKVSNWMKVYLSANYSLQYALDITDPESKSYRHQIPYTPRHCGSGSLTLEMPWATFTYRTTASGRRYSMPQNIPANEIASYADHCVCLGRDFRFGRSHDYNIHLAIEALNLAGDNYEIIRYYPMPGRSYRITLKFQL